MPKRVFRKKFKIKFEHNYRRVYTKTHDLMVAFSDKLLEKVIWNAAVWLRYKAYENIKKAPLDYKRTGGFLRAVSNERITSPKVNIIRRGKRKVFVSGAGELKTLNKIVRPKETVTFETPSGYLNTLHFKKGNFPIWLMVEYGILNKGGNVPQKFSKFVKKKSALPYRMVIAGFNISTGKPVIFMSKKVPVSYRHHPGVKGSKAYRKALRELYREKIVEGIINSIIEERFKIKR